ncbi:unnamed protein product [Polarella glacialis]|uniref:Uncharacterized protein n=1 Tax=Polarella glacialis TaxID=89957 RepID=A0A813KEK2_POLGL|nr:unnamed protein product [Polarella glacialis]CAE8606167.1 unnamed protein product [Polarella glacialis]CAE8664468.1 unnamed protein product [Polarella glacialis]CAE8702176.1 unnamed protein product [Polarella glacialis]
MLRFWAERQLHASHRVRVSNMIKCRQLLAWLLAVRAGGGLSKISKAFPQEAGKLVLAFLGDAWTGVDCTANSMRSVAQEAVQRGKMELEAFLSTNLSPLLKEQILPRALEGEFEANIEIPVHIFTVLEKYSIQVRSGQQSHRCVLEKLKTLGYAYSGVSWNGAANLSSLSVKGVKWQ